MEFKVNPLSWYAPTEDPQDMEDSSMFVAHGVGGRYHISSRQRIRKDPGMGYLLWGAKDGDEFVFTEHLSIEDAKAAAQADFDAAIRACIHID